MGASSGQRGALYRQFIDLLLQWGEDRQVLRRQLDVFARYWPETLPPDAWQSLARDALTRLASSVSFTHIPWRDAQRHVATVLSRVDRSDAAAAALESFLNDRDQTSIMRAIYEKRLDDDEQQIQ